MNWRGSPRILYVSKSNQDEWQNNVAGIVPLNRLIKYCTAGSKRFRVANKVSGRSYHHSFSLAPRLHHTLNERFRHNIAVSLYRFGLFLIGLSSAEQPLHADGVTGQAGCPPVNNQRYRQHIQTFYSPFEHLNLVIFPTKLQNVYYEAS